MTITSELLISGSTGISRPLADPGKIAAYLAGDQQTRLRRRLESDVKSLFAFYTYGLLHRHVRLRWGFVDEHLPVDWRFQEIRRCIASWKHVGRAAISWRSYSAPHRVGTSPGLARISARRFWLLTS